MRRKPASNGLAQTRRPIDVNHALYRAEQLCRERGVSFTKLRRRVLELILGAGQPAGAYDLLERFDPASLGKAPMSVYRALDFLVTQKFVHKIESLNAFVACVDVDHAHDSYFMICTCCQNVKEIVDPCVARSLRRHGKKLDFRVIDQVVELRGLCAACQSREGNVALSQIWLVAASTRAH